MIQILIIIGIVLILIFKFPKQISILLIILIIGIIGIYFYFKSEKKQQERIEIERNKQVEAVTIQIKYSPQGCSLEYPLSVTINNASSKILHNLKWQIGGKKQGFSKNIVKNSIDNDYNSDKILNPKQIYTLCYQVPSFSDYNINPYLIDWYTSSKEVRFSDDEDELLPIDE